jgi:hypothetical protein
MGTILSSGYLQSILGTALQTIGLTNKKASASSDSGNVSSLGQQPDSGQLSPFAQLINTLQQFQQSNPAQYQKVAQQIATNLQSAAQTAQAAGNQTAANQLKQLATDFSDSSQSGQVPSIQNLAQGIFGQHHQHHSQAAASGSGGNSGNQALSQLLSAIPSTGTPTGSLNPLTIIDNTLSSAGIGI